MHKTGKVLLLTGPAGSGKTTLAQYISDKSNWKYISEDDYWVSHGWSGIRSAEQEQIVQAEVMKDMQLSVENGQDVVFEFILYYNDQPNPLTRYKDKLKRLHIDFATVALKPSVEEIMRRIKLRGRPSDLENLADRKLNAENQLRCLEAEYIKSEWIIDPEELSVDELYRKCLEK
jgi:adenylate kinase family enzyme